ncbi:HAD-IIA family hydrolase [Nocardioides sp. GY 10113]|nr:HAD-IIA family hydrolase [Nocardioides sp. GY 10113]
MLDLDGVVYIGDHAVPGAAAALSTARESGMRLAFITNNASRTPEAVAAHLTDLGVEAGAADVVTSAQAAARVAVERFGEGAPVVCLGGAGLLAALVAAGLSPVGVSDADGGGKAVAVVTGYGPDVVWRDIMHAAVRIRDGLPWIASNTDGTFPSAAGIAPGHGVLVDMLNRFTGVTPVVAGKPERPLLDETVRRMGGERPLMIGDRLDTDIEGARRVGTDSLLVLTGVSGIADLVAAPPHCRPTYLASDLAGLSVPHPDPRSYAGETGPEWVVGAWSARVADGRLTVEADGAPGDTDDAWRAAVAAAWDHLDRTGDVADIAGLSLPRRARPER